MLCVDGSPEIFFLSILLYALFNVPVERGNGILRATAVAATRIYTHSKIWMLIQVSICRRRCGRSVTLYQSRCINNVKVTFTSYRVARTNRMPYVTGPFPAKSH